MHGLDTSVVVRLLTGEPPELARAALRFLRRSLSDQEEVAVSDWVLAETYHALQYHYGASKKEALTALHDFMTTPGIAATGEGARILRTPRLASAKPGFVDRLIHANYLQAGVRRMVSFEKAASRLGQVVVLSD